MLSDEEKAVLKTAKENYGLTSAEQKILVNLIEKQSKEIEELKKYEKYYEEMEEVNKKFIAVDKIKAKIEEIDENGYWEFLEKRDEDKCKDILQSLLEKE